MAIALEFIDFIIPIKIICEKYPGGWNAFVRRFQSSIGGTDWFDEYLYRTGTMNSRDIQFIAEDFKSVGFEITRKTPDGDREWIDACVYSMLSNWPICSWLAIGKVSNGREVAYLNGTEMGRTIGRRDFRISKS